VLRTTALGGKCGQNQPRLPPRRDARRARFLGTPTGIGGLSKAELQWEDLNGRKHTLYVVRSMGAVEVAKAFCKLQDEEGSKGSGIGRQWRRRAEIRLSRGWRKKLTQAEGTPQGGNAEAPVQLGAAELLANRGEEWATTRWRKH